MYGRAEDIARLEHDRPEVTTDSYRDVLAVHIQFRMRLNRDLHLDRGVHRLVAVLECREDFVAHRLDDRTTALFGRATHDVHADRDLVARSQVTQHLEEPGTADHVGKKYDEFLVLAHARFEGHLRLLL
ncbi:MAG: hypothetical protein HW392_1421 [Steroidobacteraceae bacterium]|nr:hypothetical protein [Steroidobacteraceae bacterium]